LSFTYALQHSVKISRFFLKVLTPDNTFNEAWLHVNLPLAFRSNNFTVLGPRAPINPTHVGGPGLIVGPLFVVVELAFLLGMRRDLKEQIEARVGGVRLRQNNAAA